MMGKVQRITAVLLAAMMVSALASCSGLKREDAASASPSGTVADVSATPLAGQQGIADNLTYANVADYTAYAMCNGENGELWVSARPSLLHLGDFQIDPRILLIHYGADGEVIAQYQIDQFTFYGWSDDTPISAPKGFNIVDIVRKGNIFYGYCSGPLAVFEINPEAESVRLLPQDYDISDILGLEHYGDNLALLCMPAEVDYSQFRISNPLLRTGGTPYELVEYVLAEQKMNVISLPNGPQMIAQATNGNVLVLSSDEEHYFLEVDPATGMVGDKTYIGSVGVPGEIAQTSGPNAFLWYANVDGDTVVNARFADEMGLIYIVLSDIALRGGVRLLYSGGYLYLLHQDYERYVRPDDDPYAPIYSTIHRRVFEKPAESPLQIDTSFSHQYVAQNDLWVHWSRDYRKQTSNTISVTTRFTSKEQMITAVLSGANDIDAFVMSLEDAYELGLPGNDACAPFSGDKVTQFYDGTFDWIEALFALPDSPGSYWAIPVFMDSFKLYYNPEKLAERGLTTSVFNTYDTLLPAALAMAANGVIGLGGSHHMQQNQLRQLFNPHMRTVALDSALLAVALNRITEIGTFMANDTYDLYNSSLKYRDATIKLNIDAYASNDAMSAGDDLSDFAVAPFPKLDDGIESANVMQMSILFINPHSAHKAELLQLVECIAESHLTPKPASVEYPWTPIMMKDKTVYSDVYDIDSVLFNSLHEYNANGCVSWIPDDVNTYVESFMAGEANLEDTVFAIERYMEMLERERQ